MYDTKEVKKKDKAPTLFIELCDQRDSGWRMDSSSGDYNPQGQKITSPSAEFIPSRGFRLVKGVNGEGKEEWYNEEIRYIKNQRILSVLEQKQKDIRPSHNKLEDKIIVKGGNMSVTREGAFIGLYDYIKEVFYNLSNPDRPESAKALFKVVEVGKVEEELNEIDIIQSDAVQYIKGLFYKQGGKFIYDEPKINALCNMFLIHAESASGKVSGLMGYAKRDPKAFLDKSLRFEQTIVTELAQAIEMGVVKFEGNTLQYCNKEKVVLDLGRGNLKHETKITKAAEMLGTEEYKEAYVEMQIELESAVEKQLK
jgi:hypothetical protein